MPNIPSDLSTSAKEFCNANMSKAYPLAYTTGGESGTLPSSFLVDAMLLVDGIHESTVSAYISKVEVTLSGVYLSLIVVGNSSYVFDRLVFIPTSTELFAKLTFLGSSGSVSVYGSVRVGDISSILSWPPETALTQTNGTLDETVLENVTGLFVSGLEVGGEVLTGQVTLIAGDGIELSVNGNTVTITNARYTLTGSTITNDSELLAQALSMYGNPVRTINGIRPNSTGDISIVVPATDSDNFHFIKAESTGEDGTVVLSIAKDPCADNDTVENLMENVSQLNIRCSRIDEGIKALDNALNNISVQVTRLG